jgi:hypothetical protein
VQRLSPANPEEQFCKELDLPRRKNRKVEAETIKTRRKNRKVEAEAIKENVKTETRAG